MKRRFVNVTLPICITILVAAAWLTSGGDLNPPGGPVTGTMKTLSEVEPRIIINATNTPGDADSVFRIAQPGSYYLTGNITGVSAEHGIEIASSDVTIDLMGFTLRGVPGSLAGIFTEFGGGYRNLAIRNGVVREWGNNGIDLSFGGPPSLIESIQASSNGAGGIAAGEHCVIRNCAAESNTGVGITAPAGSVIESCTAHFNGGTGIFAGEGGVVRGCTSRGNTTDGIQTDGGCSVTHCSAFNNLSDGIRTFSANTVAHCTVASNWGDGIRVTTQCLLLANNCSNNGYSGGDGAGIHAAFSENRIECNNVTGNDRGIDVDGLDNLIIQNSARSNTTNYDIAVNNKVGVIVAAPNSSAISGSTGGAGVGTTDPWANLSY